MQPSPSPRHTSPATEIVHFPASALNTQCTILRLRFDRVRPWVVIVRGLTAACENTDVCGFGDSAFGRSCPLRSGARTGKMNEGRLRDLKQIIVLFDHRIKGNHTKQKVVRKCAPSIKKIEEELRSLRLPSL